MPGGSVKKVDTNVNELVGMIRRGELRLPEMQRRYVWRAPRVRDLLDSLYRGYPSGSILVWETDQQQPTRDLAVSQEVSPFSGHKLLLDGQQRLTSLSSVLRGEPVRVRGRRRPIDILFNLEHPEGIGEYTEVEGDEDSPFDETGDDAGETEEEEDDFNVQEQIRRRTFVVGSKQIASQPNWVSVSNVFTSDNDTEILERTGVTSLKDPRYTKYSARLQKLKKIRDYPYVMYVLERGLNYEEVAEIFVRVNSLGMKLRGSDLALAQITARWPNSLKLLEQFQEECEEKWFTLDLGLLVRTMVVFATGQSRFKTVGNVPIEKLKEGWEKAKDGLRFAINFLRSNADIEDESLLSSPLLMVLIAYYSLLREERLSASDERELLYWLYIANAKGRYSGSSETTLDADLKTLAESGSVGALIDAVSQRFGRLDFTATDLVGRTTRSPVFSLVYLALKAAGAKDWHSGMQISLTHQGKLHFIQVHHIFAKALLKGRYEQKENNEIANMAFISGKTNRRLGKTAPADYLPDIVETRGRTALADQCLPEDPALHRVENYREFLEQRRALIAQRLNEFLARARNARASDPRARTIA